VRKIKPPTQVTTDKSTKQRRCASEDAPLHCGFGVRWLHIRYKDDDTKITRDLNDSLFNSLTQSLIYLYYSLLSQSMKGIEFRDKGEMAAWLMIFASLTRASRNFSIVKSAAVADAALEEYRKRVILLEEG